jgi:osmotically-inducible protein OsmY
MDAPRSCRGLRHPAALVVVAIVVAAARMSWAAAPTPTPGPVARVGGAIDRAWSQVADSVSDALLATRIRVALLNHLKEDGLRVTIEANDAHVTLSGAVKNRPSVDLAPRVARSVKGVRSVESRISLAGENDASEPPVARVVGKVERGVSDALLDARVKTRLLEELGKVAFKVEVDSSDGVVSLSGTVPDAPRQRLAVSIARSTSGVKEVHDLLTVER